MKKPVYLENGNMAVGKVRHADRKQVLLLGDSIRIGYCATTREALEDVADVYYPADNCRNSQYIITSLRGWRSLCAPEKVNVVHFNCGHWDVAHWNGDTENLTSIIQYEKNIERILDMLRALYPNARIVFATTTPMSPSGIVGVNPRTTAEIRLYNDAGRRAAESRCAEIDDLFTFTEHWGEDFYRDYCHYTEAGFKKLGLWVATYLRTML